MKEPKYFAHDEIQHLPANGNRQGIDGGEESVENGREFSIWDLVYLWCWSDLGEVWWDDEGQRGSQSGLVSTCLPRTTPE